MSRAWPVAMAMLLVCIVLAPLVLFAVPGLGDTLNHLARMHILHEIGRSPDLQRFYRVHWAPIPYLAMDAIVPALEMVVPVFVAGKIFIAACVVMPAASASLLHYALYKRWSALPLLGLPFGWSTVVSLGFLNFAFSAGLAIMLLAAWIATAQWPQWRRAALFAIPATLLYLGHAFAFLGYCIAVAGFEIALAIPRGRTRGAQTATAWLAASLQALPASVLAANLDLNAAYVGTLVTRYGTPSEKITALLSPLVFHFDRISAAIVAVTALAAFFLRAYLRIAPVALIPCLLLTAASLAIPTVLWSTWGTDLRLPMIAAILLLGGVNTIELPNLAVPALYTGVTALAVLRTIDVSTTLATAEIPIDDARKVLTHLPHGARLLIVDAQGPRAQTPVPLSTRWQIGQLAIIDRNAFTPTLFTGMTTVQTQPSLTRSATPNGLPISLAQLNAGRLTADSPTELSDGEGGGGGVYWNGWPDKFDYLLVQHGGDAYDIPAGVALIAKSGTADLLEVK